MNPYGLAFEKTTIGLIIEPLDTLFFRDGRPFGAGDYARGGLPTPQTLYGMIQYYVRQRLGIENQNPHNERDQDSETTWTRQIAVRGPWLAKVNGNTAEDIYIKPPTCLMQLRKENGAEKVLLSPLHPDIQLPGWKPPKWNGQGGLRPIVYTGDAAKLQPAEGFLNKAGLQAILDGNVPGEDGFLDKRQFPFEYEPRTGIAIDPSTRTVEHGALYTARHIRLAKGIAFYAEVGLEGDSEEAAEQLKELFSTKDGVALSFGGEGRRVLVRRASTPFGWPRANNIPGYAEGGFSTILISPAILAADKGAAGDPWHPPHFATLRAASVPKPVAVSGWSLGSNCIDDGEKKSRPGMPKPTRYAVDAGTVYFWQNGKNAPADREMPDRLQVTHKPLLKAQGWGVALRGAWKWNGEMADG